MISNVIGIVVPLFCHFVVVFIAVFIVSVVVVVCVHLCYIAVSHFLSSVISNGNAGSYLSPNGPPSGCQLS